MSHSHQSVYLPPIRTYPPQIQGPLPGPPSPPPEPTQSSQQPPPPLRYLPNTLTHPIPPPLMAQMPPPLVAAPPPSAPPSHQIRPEKTEIIGPETTVDSKETDCNLRKLKSRVRRWEDANAEDKARYKKAKHNVIERNRRTLILNRIDELATLVPPLMLRPLKCAVEHFKRLRNPPPFDVHLISGLKTGRKRLFKKTVLTQLINYIKHLLYVVEQQELERARLQQRILFSSKDTTRHLLHR